MQFELNALLCGHLVEQSVAEGFRGIRPSDNLASPNRSNRMISTAASLVSICSVYDLVAPLHKLLNCRERSVHSIRIYADALYENGYFQCVVVVGSLQILVDRISDDVINTLASMSY